MTNHGFLTAFQREYLENPEAFAAEHGRNTVRSVKMKIRKRRAAALTDFELLDETTAIWEKQVPMGGENQPPLEDEMGTVELHKDVPEGKRTSVQVHSETRDQLAAVQERIAENVDGGESITYDDLIRIAVSSMVQIYQAILETYDSNSEFQQAFETEQLGLMYLLVDTVELSELRRD